MHEQSETVDFCVWHCWFNVFSGQIIEIGGEVKQKDNEVATRRRGNIGRSR